MHSDVHKYLIYVTEIIKYLAIYYAVYSLFFLHFNIIYNIKITIITETPATMVVISNLNSIAADTIKPVPASIGNIA
jgi:hypothetical protein